MPGARVSVVNGIEYPREVPPPEGVPEGWKAIEQVYGPGSKTAGQVYTRYKSVDGSIVGTFANEKAVIKAHFEALGLPWEPEYAKFEAIRTAKADKEKEERAKEREARGQLEGEKREEMIALSRQNFGELTGPTVLGFPGWKCRWDYLPDSGQTPKTFTDTEGLEWKLLKDLECKFGVKVSQGNEEEVKQIVEMVKFGRENFRAHELFKLGSNRAKEFGGSVTIDPAEENIDEGERIYKPAGKKQRKNFLAQKVASAPDYETRSSLMIKAFGSFEHDPVFPGPEIARVQDFLLKKMFRKDTEIVLVNDSQPMRPLLESLRGVYYEKPGKYNGRPYYQQLKSVTDPSNTSQMKLVCSALHIYWSNNRKRWKICMLDDKVVGRAFSKDDVAKPFVANTWFVFKDDEQKALAGTEKTTGSSGTVKSARELSAAKCEIKDEGSLGAKVAATSERAISMDTGKSVSSATGSTEVSVGTKRSAASNTKETDAESPEAKRANLGSATSSYSNIEGSQLTEPSIKHIQKIWTYEDAKKRRSGSDLTEMPAHWPPDVRIYSGLWVPWLPPGWGQAQKEEPLGWKTKYISPDGKLFHNKGLVRKFLGKDLKDEEVIDWPDWLPKDWGKSFYMRDEKKIAIYVAPGFKRFLRTAAEVLASVNEGTVGQRGAPLVMSEQVRLMLPESVRPPA